MRRRAADIPAKRSMPSGLSSGTVRDERQPACGARVHSTARAQPSQGRRRRPEPAPQLPEPPRRPADCRGPLVPHRGTARRSDNADRVGHGARPAASRPLRRADSRGRRGRRHLRRIQRGLRRPQGTRGRRPHSPRLLREWRRRDAVRAARRARPAAIAQGRARGTGSRRPGGNRSRQSVRHDPALAGRCSRRQGREPNAGRRDPPVRSS